MTGRLLQMSGVILDAIYRVRALPAPGTEAEVTGFALSPGGGFNAMVAARRHGMAVDWGGTLGTGPFADAIAAGLAAEGITRLRPRLAGLDQGLCTVLVEPGGERTFVAAEGADGQIGPRDLSDLRVDQYAAILLSGYALGYAGSRATLTDWLTALPRGTPLVFDPAPLITLLAPSARKAALKAAAWITANAAEAQVLTGLAPSEAAMALAQGRAGALVRDGARGAWIAAGTHVTHVPAHPVSSVDTNGAGDAHTGAFIAALSRGNDPRDATALANVAAALSTLYEGPASCPDLATTLAAMAAAAPSSHLPALARAGPPQGGHR